MATKSTNRQLILVLMKWTTIFFWLYMLLLFRIFMYKTSKWAWSSHYIYWSCIVHTDYSVKLLNAGHISHNL